MRTINLEAGMPTSQAAMNTLNNRIYAERASGARCVKIIHGYGSTGRGGAIRKECRRKLLEYKTRRVIKDICPGEKFGPFEEDGRRMSAVCPEVRNDIDWGRSNPGITIVMFK
ncbi:MAG: Smr/MutS family protein [Saccharofermentans sp.]|nr:Smr/MutS family protein [Saccharofermentans sp.]